MYTNYDDEVRFQPLTDEQLEFLNRRIEPGIVHFKILDIKKGASKDDSRRIWIMVKFNATDKNGISEIGTDFLWIDGKTQNRLKEFLSSVNKENAFSQGSFKLSELTDLEGELDCYFKDEKGKDGNIYTKLKVKKWLPKINNTPEFDDDIPFT